MDKTVPNGAALLLDFIRDTEVGTTDRSSYDVIYGHNQNKLDKPVTSMSLSEAQSQQRSWSKRFGSSATGGYQFMRATLAGLIDELDLSLSQKLNPDLQDRLGFHLLVRRGYHSYMDGRINRTQFGKRLAQEWASFPVLADTKGAHRQLKRGQSYYAGDGLNKALVAPERIEDVLDEVKHGALSDSVPVPVPVPGVDKPLYKSTTFWSAIGGVFSQVGVFLADLHPAVQVTFLVLGAGFAVWIINERRLKASKQRELLEEFI